MTKGKMVLELLIYAKSAIKKFRPIRGLHCGHVTSKYVFCDFLQITSFYLYVHFGKINWNSTVSSITSPTKLSNLSLSMFKEKSIIFLQPKSNFLKVYSPLEAYFL